MKKIMLCYPPGDLSTKIKNRYKYRLQDLVPPTMRACNDLGYMAATLRNAGNDVFLKDYKITRSSALDFLDDILKYSPDMIVMTTSYANVHEDLKLVRMIKSSNPQISVILKSEMFFDAPEELLCNLPLGGVDYLIGSDAAFIMPLIVKAHYSSNELVYQIPFLTICKNGLIQKTNFHAPHGNIAELPFPARDLMKNEYYYRPDNKKVTATIYTANGHFSDCIFGSPKDLSPNELNIRPAKNVFDEVYECFLNHGIRSFFFPSESFTNNEKWIEEFCDYIINSPMRGQVEIIANVDIAHFTEYMAIELKAAGCTLLIMRFDCGTDDSLLRMKRGFTIDESLNAVDIAEKTKLKIYGMYSIGLPWENEEHLMATRKLMVKISADIMSIAMPIPYPGTKLEQIFREENILKEQTVFKDGIKIPSVGTKFLTNKKLRKFRRKTLLLYYLNPKFMFKKFIEATKRPELFKKYFDFLMDLFADKRR